MVLSLLTFEEQEHDLVKHDPPDKHQSLAENLGFIGHTPLTSCGLIKHLGNRGGVYPMGYHFGPLNDTYCLKSGK